jgi:hypothetical protein
MIILYLSCVSSELEHAFQRKENENLLVTILVFHQDWLLPKKKKTVPRMPLAAIRETTTNITTPPVITNDNPRRPNSPSFLGIPRFLATTPTWDFAATRAFNQLQRRNEKPREKAMVDNWKQSIIGLIRLADQDLRLAEQQIVTTDFKTAIQTAAISVENIARAFIHCYGGKPDDDLGQQEVLKLLS